MEVTYGKLRDGYILKYDDKLCLHGINYLVDRSGSRCWLRSITPGVINSGVFSKLNIEDRKYSFCKAIVGDDNVVGGLFPETNSLENLTKIVKALYEKSPYKVGDKVQLNDSLTADPWVVQEMEKYVGKVVTICDIDLACSISYDLKGDPHKYSFKEIPFTWSSVSFHKWDGVAKEEEEHEEEHEEEKKEEKPVEKKPIRYEDLKAGYIFKDEDVLYLKGIRYEVHCGGTPTFLVNRSGGFNDEIFKLLGCSSEEKNKWAKEFNSLPGNTVFPVFNTYGDLTRFVISIYEKIKESDIGQPAKAISHLCQEKTTNPDCRFVDESIIIQQPKSKTKTTIKL